MTSVVRPAGTAAPVGAGAAGLRVPVGILSTGVHLPPRVVPNSEIVRGLDTTEEWIEQRTGILSRRFLDPGQSTSDMCVAAGRQAIERAGISAADLDAVVVATFTQDQPLPSTALIVKEALGATRAWPLDLNQAACAGGVHGILVASHLMQNDHFRHVLVIGAEALSRITDPADRTTRVFFGDAAGAVVLGRTAPGFGLLSWDVGADLSYSVQVPAGGSSRPATAETVGDRAHYLKMDGRVVWEQATERMPVSIRRAVSRAGLSLGDVRHFVLHQANRNIIEAALKALEVPLDRAAVTIDVLGNTGAATIFTVLDRLAAAGEPQPGDVVAISAIGAGFLWGTLCFRQF
ncbi:3-oxoacyl-ACP synthase III family protein [Lentzea sp. NPDC055074]